MSQYAIAEVEEGEGFKPRGAIKELWSSRDREIIISGPAETGKTYGCLQYADTLLWKHPGAHGVMLRKTYSALVGSVLRTYIRIIGTNSPIKAYGNNKPEWFDYPNGSRMWVAGLDDPRKSLSSERDFFYVNQAEEIDLNTWETLSTRCTGRGAVMPSPFLFGDCNPSAPTHWILHRDDLRLLESRHEDNPTLFDDEGRITEQGIQTLAILDKLTGVRYLRLRKGKWVQAEGVVYVEWDPAVNWIDPFAIPAEWPRFVTIDFGYTNPFVMLWFAQDPDGRLFLYREIYMTHVLVEDHAKRAKIISEGDPDPVEILADHDAEGRGTFEKYFGKKTRPARKAISEGIQALSSRIVKAGDGRPRFFIFKGCLDREDPFLVSKGWPTCTAQEFDVYVWNLEDGRRKGEIPVDKFNHGMDACRYMAARDLKTEHGAPTAGTPRPNVPLPSGLRSGVPTAGRWSPEPTKFGRWPGLRI